MELTNSFITQPFSLCPHSTVSNLFTYNWNFAFKNLCLFFINPLFTCTKVCKCLEFDQLTFGFPKEHKINKCVQHICDIEIILFTYTINQNNNIILKF